MAITTQIMHDGERNLSIKIHITDNAGGDYLDQVLFDVATLTPPPATLRLNFIEASAIGLNAVLNNEGATDAHLLTLPEGETVFDYSKISGLRNEAVTPTGNILLTTAGLAAGDNMTIYMELIKQI